MKKHLFIILAALTFVACSEDEPSPNGKVINEINEVPTQVEAFFSEIETLMWSGKKVYDFTFSQNEIKVINSMEELSDLYTGEKELPEIDFSSYTLLVGHVLTPDTGHRLDRIVLTGMNERLTLNVYIRKLDSGYPLTVVTPILYWGLYPKLPNEPVVVNITQL